MLRVGQILVLIETRFEISSMSFNALIILYPLIIGTFSLGQKGCAYSDKSAYYECAYHERVHYLFQILQ